MTTYPLSPEATITVDIPAASLLVRAVDRADADIGIEPSNPNRAGDREAAERVSVSTTTAGLTVAAERRLLIGASGSVDVHIDVPVGTHLSANIAAGSATLRNHLGDVDVKISAGGVRGDVMASLRAKVSHGGISVDEVTGDVVVQQSSGDAQLGTVRGRADIKAGHGGIRIDQLEGAGDFVTATGGVQISEVGNDTRIKTGHGTIRLARVKQGALVVESGYGAIEVGIVPGAPVWIDADSKRGVVRTDLDTDSGPMDDEAPIEVHANTKFGDIFINRAG